MAESMTIRAYVKELAIAPRKVALVASLVRGRSVADALVILSHTPKRSALPVSKAIESARANAVNTHGLDTKTLTISTLSVTAGTRLKRFKPASRGRALPFEKKTANILVEVTGQPKPKKPATSTKATDTKTATKSVKSAGKGKI